MRPIIAVLVLTVVLVGSIVQAQEEGPPTAISEPRNAAVSFALTMDLVTGSLASTCAKADDALAVQAPAARAAWTAHNGRFVDAAHQYLLFVSAVVSSKQGEEAGRAFYDAQRTRFMADAQTALTDSFPGGGIDAAGCERVVERLRDGSMNLEAKAELFKSLVEIDDAISQVRERP